MKKHNAPAVAPAIAVLLADTFVLGLKTQNYHWNVTGPEFFSLHKLFEEQYNTLFDSADVIAERLRAIGQRAPGGLAEFAKLTKIADAKTGLSADAMLKDLIKSHEHYAATLKNLIEVSDAADDNATNDMAVGLLEGCDKMCWMLSASAK